MEFPSEGTAAELASDGINLVQMVMLQFAGPIGAMNEVEYSLSTRGLTTLIQKTPIAQVSKLAGFAAPAVLAAGLGLWMLRLTRIARAASQIQQQTQVTDTATPANAAPPEDIVRSSKPGDVNGIAVPIPDAILQASRLTGDI